MSLRIAVFCVIFQFGVVAGAECDASFYSGLLKTAVNDPLVDRLLQYNDLHARILRMPPDEQRFVVITVDTLEDGPYDGTPFYLSSRVEPSVVILGSLSRPVDEKHWQRLLHRTVYRPCSAGSAWGRAVIYRALRNTMLSMELRSCNGIAELHAKHNEYIQPHHSHFESGKANSFTMA